MNRWIPLLALLATVLTSNADAQSRVDRQGQCVLWGDGHVVMFDGPTGNMYGSGVYLLTDSADPDQPFRVEVDAQPLRGGMISKRTRAAIRCAEHLVVAEAGSEGTVQLDGDLVEAEEAAFGVDEQFTLLSGPDLVVVRCRDHEAQLRRVDARGSASLDVQVRKAYYLVGGEPTQGLCGTFDGVNNERSTYDPSNKVDEEESLFAQFQPPPPAEIPGAIYTHPGTLEFDGTNNVWLDGPFSLTPDFHLSAEVRVDASEQWNHLIEIGSHEYGWNGPLRFEVGNEGEWYVSVGDGAGFKELYQQGNWTYGEWTKVEVEYRGGAIRLFETGDQLGMQQADINVASVSGELNLGNFARGGRHFRGAMRNLVIRALD